MVGEEIPTSRRTIMATLGATYHAPGGHVRTAGFGDDADLLPLDEQLLEAEGHLLPIRWLPPERSVNRPSVAAMIDLAKIEMRRGRRDRAQRVLDAELLAGELARADVVEGVRRILVDEDAFREHGALSLGEIAAITGEALGAVQVPVPARAVLDGLGAG